MNGDDILCPDLNQVCIERTDALRAELDAALVRIQRCVDVVNGMGRFLTGNAVLNALDAENPRPSWQARAEAAEEMLADARREHAAAWAEQNRPNLGPVHPWPDCPDHREVQHRDYQPPWCNACGWNRGRPATKPFQGRKP